MDGLHACLAVLLEDCGNGGFLHHAAMNDEGEETTAGGDEDGQDAMAMETEGT